MDSFSGLGQEVPRNLLEEKYELQLFYNGLYVGSKNIVNASTGGTISEKMYEEVKELSTKLLRTTA